MSKVCCIEIESYRNFKSEAQHISRVDIDIYGDECDLVMNGCLFLDYDHDCKVYCSKKAHKVLRNHQSIFSYLV